MGVAQVSVLHKDVRFVVVSPSKYTGPKFSTRDLKFTEPSGQPEVTHYLTTSQQVERFGDGEQCVPLSFDISGT